jgi:hypothetical protein
VLEPHGEFDLSGYADVMEAIIAVITRHPMVEEDLVETLERFRRGEVERALETLEESGRASVVTRYGKRFWSAAHARYGDSERGPHERHRGLGTGSDDSDTT